MLLAIHSDSFLLPFFAFITDMDITGRIININTIAGARQIFQKKTFVLFL
jgi:hypothetical protein